MADLNLGSRAIDVEEVVVPDSEAVTGLTIHLTKDQKWSEFPVKTTLRAHTINPGSAGQKDFADFCVKMKAMFDTTEGQAVVAAIDVELAKIPVSLKTQVVMET